MGGYTDHGQSCPAVECRVVKCGSFRQPCLPLPPEDSELFPVYSHSSSLSPSRCGSRIAEQNADSSGSSRNSSSSPQGDRSRFALRRGRQAHPHGPLQMFVQTLWASQIPTAPLCLVPQAHLPQQWPLCPFGVRPRSLLCLRPSELGWWPQGPLSPQPPMP